MDERTKELIEKVERRASVRAEHTGPSRSDYRTVTEACEDLLALCGALRKTDAEREREVDLHRQEREAWIEFYRAERAYNKNVDRTKADALLVDMKHKLRILITFGVPSETFV